MLYLNQSNRFEVLQEKLCDKLASHPAPVFTPLQVIVPSAAIKRRLMLSIADRFGVCANVSFAFLAQWLWELVGKAAGSEGKSPFSPDVLSWRILRVLGDDTFVRAHPRLSAYLDRCDDAMRFELACRIATLFDRYGVYRTQWLESWAKGEMADIGTQEAAAQADQAWQADLWARIVGETGTDESGTITALLAMLISGDEKVLGLLPERLHLFCEPTVAPPYIRILRELGRHTDIELYVMNPCREYWFDIVDERRMARLESRDQVQHHEILNPLLASWGKQCSASLGLMMSKLDALETEDSDFVNACRPDSDNPLLARIQDSMLDLQEWEDASQSAYGTDDSLEIHVAHSLTREIEILHDQLLRRFASDDAPSPSDMLVVTPDLDTAAPMIDAVFRHNGSGVQIPYVITGRRSNRLNPVARALLDILALASSRCTASAVMDVLMLPEVGATFGFDGDRTLLRRWLDDAGICWALDGEHKAAFDVPSDEKHTFRDGMHRLFLAYALPEGMQSPVAGRLPAGHGLGLESAGLGQLWRFIGAIDRLRHDLDEMKTPQGWQQCWLAILDTFVTVTPALLDSDREVRSRIADLCETMTFASDTFAFSHVIAMTALEKALEGAGQGSVPAGVVVFAPMHSLRNLPYDHIFAIGLNDGAYPADNRPDEFDLIALSPRSTDRTPRDTDKNVFLDLLLSARKSLYLSYTGKSIRDDSAKPPSILIDELLDVLSRALASSGKKDDIDAARKRLMTEHPLQPFSGRYFDGSSGVTLSSFRSDLCRALQNRYEKTIETERHADDSSSVLAIDEGDGDAPVREAGEPFFTGISAPDEAWREVLLHELIRFFSHPNRYLLRQRLDIRFPSPDEELPADEPLVPDRSASRMLADRILPMYLAGQSDEAIRRASVAGNEFPAGRIGSDCIEGELKAMSAFASTLSGDLAPEILPPVTRTLDFTIAEERWRLSGSLTDLRPNGLVRYRYRPKTHWACLPWWIEHLFLNACTPEVGTCLSVWHFTDKTLHIGPVKDAQALLSDLLKIYRRGLSQPLPFFPNTSWAFVESGGQMNKAREKWDTAYAGYEGESDDPYNRLAMRGNADPLAEEAFPDLARRVFGALVTYCKGENA